MNRYLGSAAGAPALAREMARVSNDRQFRQNPDAAQHATIRAMGQHDTAFAKTIGDTARSRAFSALPDRDQLALMDRLGGATAPTRAAFDALRQSDRYSLAAPAAQASMLRGFDADARTADARTADAQTADAPENGEADRTEGSPPPPGAWIRAAGHALPRENHPSVATDAAPPDRPDHLARPAPAAPAQAPSAAEPAQPTERARVPGGPTDGLSEPSRPPADRPPADPLPAETPTEAAPSVRRQDLSFGERLGRGAHSEAHALDDGRVAVTLQSEASPEAADHLRKQVDYMRQLEGVQFEGRPVAPRVDSLITDDADRVTGYVTDRVYGETLQDISFRGGLDDAQFAEARRQLEGQMNALHRAGFIHGDANMNNALVQVGPDGDVRARFIDFEPPNESFHSPRADREILDTALSTADAARRPEAVAQHFQKQEELRFRREQADFLATKRSLTDDLRSDANQLRRMLPESNVADRQLLGDIRQTLAMGKTEARHRTLDDFDAARTRLQELNAVDRLEAMNLDGQAANARDRLQRELRDGFIDGWKPPRAIDPARAQVDAARAAEARHTPAADRGAGLGGLDEQARLTDADRARQATTSRLDDKFFDQADARLDEFGRRISADDIVDAPAFRNPETNETVRAGHWRDHLRNPQDRRLIAEGRQRITDTVNGADFRFTGINENNRPVDVYVRNDTVVVTEAGKKNSVITAYGRGFVDRSTKTERPVTNVDKWLHDPSYVEYQRYPTPGYETGRPDVMADAVQRGRVRPAPGTGTALDSLDEQGRKTIGKGPAEHGEGKQHSKKTRQKHQDGMARKQAAADRKTADGRDERSNNPQQSSQTERARDRRTKDALQRDLDKAKLEHERLVKRSKPEEFDRLQAVEREMEGIKRRMKDLDTPPAEIARQWDRLADEGENLDLRRPDLQARYREIQERQQQIQDLLPEEYADRQPLDDISDDLRAPTRPGPAAGDEARLRADYEARIPNDMNPAEYLRDELGRTPVPNPTADVKTYADIPSVRRSLERLERLADEGKIDLRWAEYGEGSAWNNPNRSLRIGMQDNPVDMMANAAHEMNHVPQGNFRYEPGMTRDEFIRANADSYINGEFQSWRTQAEMYQDLERYGFQDTPEHIRDVQRFLDGTHPSLAEVGGPNSSSKARRNALKQHLLDRHGYQAEYDRMFGRVYDETVGAGHPERLERDLHRTEPPEGTRQPKAGDPAVDPPKIDGLTEAEHRRLGALTRNEADAPAINRALGQAQGPEDARRVLDALEAADPASRRAMAEALGQMSPEGLGRFMNQTVGDDAAGAVLGRMMHAMPEEGRDALGRVVGALSPEHAADFMKFGQHLDGRTLSEAVGTLDTALTNLGRIAPEMVDDVGKMFGAMDSMVTRLGVPMSRQVAGRVMRGIGAMLPAVGAGFSGYETIRMGRIAADSSLPAELRYLGGLGVGLNATDTGLAVAEMFGVGNVGLPAGLALGATAIGLDLYTHHQIDQFRANPDEWAPSQSLNAFIAGSSLAMGPAGAAMLVGAFGPTGAEEKILDLGHVGGKLGIETARLGGLVAADATGQGLKLSARGIDALADTIRNPEQIGPALRRLGISTQQATQNAIGALGRTVDAAGALGGHAQRALGRTADWLATQGQQGLDTLEWMWNHPGQTTNIAQDRLVAIAERGDALARQAWDGLVAAGDRGLEAAHQAMLGMQTAGQQGLDMLEYAYRNPGQAADRVQQWAVDGIHNVAQQGGEMTRQAVRSLVDFVEAQPRMATKALDALTDLAQRGGTALDELGQAWSKNLTEGGQAVLRSLENLGDAGAEALGRLGRYGGTLATNAADALGRLVDRGYREAGAALGRMADAVSPAHLRKVWDNMSWSGARRLLETNGRALRQRMINALGAPRMAHLINASGTNIEWIRTHLANSLQGARSLSSTLQRVSADGLRKLRGALGVDRITRTLGWMKDQGIAYGQDLVNSARTLGDRAIKEAMGLIDYVAPRNNMGYRLLSNNTVPPWDPRAEWWFGLENPF